MRSSETGGICRVTLPFRNSRDDLPALQETYRASEAPPLVHKMSRTPASTGGSAGAREVAPDTPAQSLAENFSVTIARMLFFMSPKQRVDDDLERFDTCGIAPRYPGTTDRSRKTTISPARLRTQTAGLLRQAPLWADRLSHATTDQEVLEIVSKLLNLSIALTPPRVASLDQRNLSSKITRFIDGNLYKGLTLKLLAEFLGYSEKYCSEVFQSAMGESFSGYLKRRRTEIASSLLTTTDQSVAEIASVLGFSDQFSFSHFFKRSTGQPPSEFRTDRGRRRPIRTNSPPFRTRR